MDYSSVFFHFNDFFIFENFHNCEYSNRICDTFYRNRQKKACFVFWNTLFFRTYYDLFLHFGKSGCERIVAESIIASEVAVSAVAWAVASVARINTVVELVETTLFAA